jgi:hypothetical protein
VLQDEEQCNFSNKGKEKAKSGHGPKRGARHQDKAYRWESEKERDHWEDQDVYTWKILRWILET